MTLVMWTICAVLVVMTSYFAKRNWDIATIGTGLFGVVMVCYTVKHFTL